MRSRNDNNAAALGSAGGLEERVREYLCYEKLAIEYIVQCALSHREDF